MLMFVPAAALTGLADAGRAPLPAAAVGVLVIAIYRAEIGAFGRPD
ncbi:hypothetical protein [Paractinoplanes lichenicola]|uniref:Uncharacterized protein n=1 Tax=Paractinoplanes lichenicola TaxID=2802976 RepID=A0ABS1VH99_9ACTN|nr:hypothetical protein [Actinoplanes lichenicola]MBL7254081.1 hypothetical protein [Actinoplanes lichenicola]